MTRKKPFSGKKKKEQLKEKRDRRREQAEHPDLTVSEKRKNLKELKREHRARQAGFSGGGRPPRANRLATVFEQDSAEDIERRKGLAKLPFVRNPNKPVPNFYDSIIDIPKRPPWNHSMSKEQVEANEKKMFDRYLSLVTRRYRGRLNYFEQNLEVWRQLWRVCEISDVICILADVRYPIFHFPPALYHYVMHDLKKPLVLVLTKVDLVPAENVHRWMKFFEENFPGLRVTPFASYEKKDSDGKIMLGMKKKKRHAGKLHFFPTGAGPFMKLISSFGIKKHGETVEMTYVPPNAQELPSDIAEVVSEAQAFREAHEQRVLPAKLAADDNDDDDDDDDDEADEVDRSDDEEDDDLSTGMSHIEEAKREDHYAPTKEMDYVTLGLIGNPNVGKSTFINALKGRKVCSTSRTPGHTKWKQTIFLDKNLMLCDCPGLVFPAVELPKPLQILCGIFPIAQVREPYSAIQYLCERVAVESIYDLKPVGANTSPAPTAPPAFMRSSRRAAYDDSDQDEDLSVPESEETIPPVAGPIVDKSSFKWSAWAICEAYAEKRGYRTKHGNYDTHRAGLEILFDVIDGRIVLHFLPDQQSLNLDVYRNAIHDWNTLLDDYNEEDNSTPLHGEPRKLWSEANGTEAEEDGYNEDDEVESLISEEEDDEGNEKHRGQEEDTEDEEEDESLHPAEVNRFAALM